MKRDNSILSKAKQNKNDEFYTLYESVEKEIRQFNLKGKKGYCRMLIKRKYKDDGTVNQSSFKIIGILNDLYNEEIYEFGRPIINGKEKYARVLISRNDINNKKQLVLKLFTKKLLKMIWHDK